MDKSLTRREFNTRLLADLVTASTEGFFHRSELDQQRLGVGSRSRVVAAAVTEGKVGSEGDYIYDPARLTAEQAQERSALYRGSLPSVTLDGVVTTLPIAERLKQRQDRLSSLADPAINRILAAFAGTPGYFSADQLCKQPGDDAALMALLSMNLLKRVDNLIFDPLLISRGSLNAVLKQRELAPLRQQILDLLTDSPGKTTGRVELVEKFGAKVVQAMLESSDFALFSVPIPLGESVWVRLRDSDPDEARRVAIEAVRPKDEDWQAALDYAGNMLKADGIDGRTLREQVLARSYVLVAAAHRLGVRKETLQSAIGARRIIAFVDPEGQTRIPADELEIIRSDPDSLQHIEDLEVVRIRELQIVLDEPKGSVIYQRLRRIKNSHSNKVRWGQIRNSLWNPPITLAEFREMYRERKAEWLAAQEEQKATERRKRDEVKQQERARREEDRRQREELRARLLAAFPTWQHAGRADQRVLFHVGPPNSGKTHSALDALSEVESGWYLAPLRLLAFEVFERLNRRGVPCNLLTGEEHISIPGATVTAATIEMFNPNRSGECVVIDEAQMLADPDRGWAWTRALMEAQATDIRVIGPLHARQLIERLASAAAIPLEIIQHQRLAPLTVASKSWPIQTLPARTILVAFSRQMVLRLKNELENYRRRVSVVYGNLPPEVRRKQADRFADGETEICIATDAVGMGLNLPADRVCFYELEKFDGKMMRQLTPSEIHQIGGRAGRYGMSSAGEIGATNRRDLKILQALYNIAPSELQRARVAPVVDDLALIPGNLAHRFARWRELQSIPETLRDVIEPADIDERIALAQMLTDRQVEYLGLATAIQLVNAPTRESSRPYWFDCAKAILANKQMPLPPEVPFRIDNSYDLDMTEKAIACADIYLWLACRLEFGQFGMEELRVRELRTAWSMSIDAALMRQVDTAARCISCRRKLPLNHRFSLCDDCYNSRSEWLW